MVAPRWRWKAIQSLVIGLEFEINLGVAVIALRREHQPLCETLCMNPLTAMTEAFSRVKTVSTKD